MGENSKIEWTDTTWNPVMGCTPVSEGCENCYARAMIKRFAGCKGWPDAPGEVTLFPERLEQPLHWSGHKRIFIPSMGDLFHIDVRSHWLEDIFATITDCPQHIFQILTKRPGKMKIWFEWYGNAPENVWLGVTAENQAAADERIPLLLQTPAAVRFVSCEPLLGRLYLVPYLREWEGVPAILNWVIVGGESGPGARPMHPDWARELRNQCQAAGVPFFFKQWGAWLHGSQFGDEIGRPLATDMHCWTNNLDASYRVGKKAAGRRLDGCEWNEWPSETSP
jgi:protein gp37